MIPFLLSPRAPASARKQLLEYPRVTSITGGNRRVQHLRIRLLDVCRSRVATAHPYAEALGWLPY